MIKRLMELGVMVESDAAAILEKGNADKVMEKLLKMQPMPFSVNAELARRLLTEPAQIKLLKKVSEMKGMSIPDFVAGYNERYSALQKVLLKNPALGSTVSIASAAGGCCIIGMVKNGGKTIEDPSGEGTFVTDARLLDGDVIGAVGIADGGVFKANEIIFPGVQLKERANPFGTFTAGRGADSAVKTDVTTFYDANGAVVVSSDADLSQISKHLGVSEKEAALELLKRRHLTAAPKDYLEPQPDFLIFNAQSEFVEKYKGVVVIGVKEGGAAEIDLNANEVAFK